MTDRVLYSGEWLQIVERNGWIFSRETTSGGVVYVLVMDTSRANKQILGRFEACPAHGDTIEVLTSITGGVNIEQTPISVAVEEVYEEAGYRIDEKDLTDMGKVNLTKSTDTIGHLYYVDVKGKDRVHAPGDGSFGEIGLYCDWVSVKEAVTCKCPVMGTLLMRYYMGIASG